MADSREYIANPRRTAEIMQRYDIKMKKSLGQNFLTDTNILRKMIQTADISERSTVIEIGPGIGALTEFLAIHAAEVYAFEIDQRFITILSDTLQPYTNVTVLNEDILNVDFQSEAYDFLREAEDLVVVANLPYYITTPIIMHLLNSQLPIQRLVMMMQKEVVERMTADVGTKAYNSLSIAIQNTMEAELAFIVPRTVFIPPPNVDSAVLRLTRRPVPLAEVDDLIAFEAFIQACFTQRRKTLWNNLRTYYMPNQEEHLRQAFIDAEIDPQQRAESLTIHDYERLYRALHKGDI